MAKKKFGGKGSKIKASRAKLEKEKSSVEETLKGFAQKDKKPEGDWDANFPKFGAGNLEEAADEVEEYGSLLALEHNLETRLRDIDSALKKIEKGKYGKCEKCGKKISGERLKLCPEARFCQKCNK